MTQAKRGGEKGINGEFYKGGQFMANSELTVKGAQNGASGSQKARKVQSARGVWEIAPDGMLPLYRYMGAHVWVNPETQRAEPFTRFNPVGMGWKMTYAEAMRDAQRIADLWNSGERWEAA